MDYPIEHHEDETKWTKGQALARLLLRRYRRPHAANEGPSYCGHLGSRTDLEVQLWRYVESDLDEEEEQRLEDHVDRCGYCQSRTRSMARALREVPPETVPAAKAACAVLQLRRVAAIVKDAGGEFWTEVLVAAESAGGWLFDSLGAGLILRPLPIVRGLDAGATKGVEPQARSIRSFVPALRTSLDFQGVTLSCEIRADESNLSLRIDAPGCRGIGLGLYSDATCRVDGGPETMASCGSQGMTFTFPHSARRVDLRVYRNGAVVGQMVLTLE
jgi:hypothetical protein